MSDGKIVVTLKDAGGPAAPWIVISGDTPEEVLDLVNRCTALFGATKTASETFQNTKSDSAHAALVSGLGAVQVQSTVAEHNSAVIQQQQAPAPQVAPQSVPDGLNFCTQHNQARNYKEGTNKAGRAYKGWFCPMNGCAPKWVS